jgi:hypothetical protein
MLTYVARSRGIGSGVGGIVEVAVGVSMDVGVAVAVTVGVPVAVEEGSIIVPEEGLPVGRTPDCVAPMDRQDRRNRTRLHHTMAIRFGITILLLLENPNPWRRK